MLKLPFTSRQRRYTACMTLFAWMFALVSGVANACLIHPGAPGETGSDSSQAEVMDASALRPAKRDAEPVHHHADHDRGDGGRASDGSKAGCLKFCADESTALIKSKAAQADVSGLIFLTSVQWQLPARVAVVWQRPPVERPATVGPPVFIRLMRLTI